MTLLARIDANQPAIAKALADAGCSVQRTHAMGGGFPDLIVGRAGLTFMLEVKRPGETLDGRQEAWHAGWRGHVAIVTTPEEALRAVGIAIEPREAP
jgi:hypothetical protein